MRLRIADSLHVGLSLVKTFLVTLRRGVTEARQSSLANDAKRMIEAIETLKDAMSDAYRELSQIQKRVAEQAEDDE